MMSFNCALNYIVFRITGKITSQRKSYFSFKPKLVNWAIFVSIIYNCVIYNTNFCETYLGMCTVAVRTKMRMFSNLLLKHGLNSLCELKNLASSQVKERLFHIFQKIVTVRLSFLTNISSVWPHTRKQIFHRTSGTGKEFCD